MKKIIILVSLLSLASVVSFAQSVDDALRYAKTNLSGTARYVSMGGAFGALGGDISSISDNPAATGVFMYSEWNISPSLYHSVNETNFMGNTTTDNKYNFNLNNLGFVGSLKIKKNDWKYLNYAFSYKRMDNYHHNIYAEGINNSSSITDFFASQANGTSLSDLDNNYDGAYVGDNAYQTYLIDPDSVGSTNTSYHSMYNSYGQNQIHAIKTKGRRSDYSFSVGGNYKNKLYLGASLNYTSLKYTYASDFQEHDVNGTIDNFKSMQYRDEYTTTGEGYALKLGLIFRPIKWLRVGYSIHTPVNYSLSDEYSHVIDSWGIESNGEVGQRTSTSPIGLYDYNITSPFRMNSSLGFVIGKRAVIGLEYELVDYTAARISSGKSVSEFSNENALIKDIFDTAHNLKAGFEYRLGQISFRAGVSYFDSPYKDTELNNDAYTIYYNGGVGFNVDYFYIDLAYSYSQSNYHYYPYQVDNSTPYEIAQNTSKFVATMGIRF